MITMTQVQANATTDPAEVRALNAIFQKWNISAPSNQWNISGEPCSGVAIDDTSLDDDKFSVLIKCECSDQNGSTTCHISQLKVFAMDVVGEIPAELWTLTYLFNLNLNQNYLTGTLSPSIGNLSRMQYLGLAANSLSGELPKQLGNLTDLRSLSILENNFSGSLPSELGNLVKLEQLYISSSGISGEIPLTFANLGNLKIVWASDIELKGRIPDFIGKNWSKLKTLRFQGNSFEGPIPASLSNLTNLEELKISELSKQSPSLDFMQNLKSLMILVLRNNNISDTIPTNLGEFQSLNQLDLSFNNLIGQIPNSLFNLNSLSYLFLGNNKLNGTIPAEKSASLLNIDLSNNNLTGSFPSWITEQNLQLNLVGNNFKVENSENSGMPPGLKCLQRDFPCNRGIGVYYNFSINCGGPQIATSDGIVYEKDDETLGPATYFVTDTERWAVSNVGYFSGSTKNQYRSSVANQFIGTLDSNLFQTARLSASSLRYYGLGLENGHYNVSLRFAESMIPNSTSWRSFGRRVFNVYIQGDLVLKDFDIQKEAGKVSFKAVQKEFRAQVLENYLEIHFFWAGKGTCCIPDQFTYGPLISALSAIPDFIPSVSNKSLTSKKKKTGLIGKIALGVGVLTSIISFFVVCFAIKRRRHHVDENEELLGTGARPNTFSYSELKNATNDFDSANKLGQGGFGPVYKGTLDDGTMIAVKQLSTQSRQGNSEFMTEIATISAVQHRNLIKLHGCCIEKDKQLLVYEYLENGSLNQLLFGNGNSILNWPMRYSICSGIARGLAYLHEESRLRIIHRDVKASNILLDHQFIPKISDFGLAKLFDEEKTHLSTRLVGTMGYLAPEYAWRGHLTEKADVFSFGIVALEIVSGRQNSVSSFDIEGNETGLLERAWNLHINNNEIELVDSKLSEFDEMEVKQVVGISLLCTQASPALRPSMSRVVAMLSGDVEVTRVNSMPAYLAYMKFDDVADLMNTNNGIDMSYHHTSANTSIRGDIN